MFSSHGAVLPGALGGSIHRAMQRVGGRRGSRAPTEEAAAPSSSASCSEMEEDKSEELKLKEERRGRLTMRHYRLQLEQEVEKLQKELQEKIDLHNAFTNAVARNATVLLKSPNKLPYQAQELLATVASLDCAVSQLEKELRDLQYQLCHERNERLLAETHVGGFRTMLREQDVSKTSTSLAQHLSTSTCSWEEHIASLRDISLSGPDDTGSISGHMLLEVEDQRFVSLNMLLKNRQDEEEISTMLESPSLETDGVKRKSSSEKPDQKITKIKGNIWNNPNQLSEEMVRCMRNIFLCLSESSKLSQKVPSSEGSSLPVDYKSSSILTSFLDSPIMPALLHNPASESNSNDKVKSQVRYCDPYKVNSKEMWRDLGSYGLAVEVSWMSVGEEQLAYASEALRKFRFLVEQLSKVNAECMSSDEKLAFWINLYNALLMHAFLAYGVPKNDVKLFVLMQKASYMVGGQSFSAADIEFTILKMKPLAHRPQLALILAKNKTKITEEHLKYSIDDAEPLALFALSCGMFSSPAVRILSAENVRQQLKDSMRDYIQASIGINDKGKLLVPKLLHSYAKGIVEDSLLADWICHHLTSDQLSVIQDFASQRKQRLLGVRSFNVIPFDSKFRYLFLPDHLSLSASK